MTPEERILCRGLVITPLSATRTISKEEFARRFPSAIEHGTVAARILEEAYTSKNSDDVQCVLIVGHSFGFVSDHVGILARLLEADWHVSHEDVVSALEKLRNPASVSALYRATQWIPEYLSYDDSRALAVKAIWALGKLPGNEAEDALNQLAASRVTVIQHGAKEQLQRRKI